MSEDAPPIRPADYTIPSAEDLRQLRLIAGLDVRELARRLNRCEDTICRWERGETDPRTTDTQQMLEIFTEEIVDD